MTPDQAQLRDVTAEAERLRAENADLRLALAETLGARGDDRVAERRDALRRHLGLGASAAAVLEALLARPGELVRMERLYKVLWPAGPDEEPQLIRNGLRVRISLIRRALRPLGLTVRCAWGEGYGLDAAVCQRIEALLARPAPARVTARHGRMSDGGPPLEGAA